MEGLIVILIILFAVVKSGKKNKKKEKTPDMSATARKEVLARAIQRSGTGADSTAEFMKELQNAVNQRAAQNEGEKAPVQAKQPPRTPSAPRPAKAPKPHPTPAHTYEIPVARPVPAEGADSEGCLGGSMPHLHTEGESRAEHAMHMAAMERRDEESWQADPINRNLGGIDRTQLRRAVIMAEILDKPKALRRRTAGR